MTGQLLYKNNKLKGFFEDEKSIVNSIVKDYINNGKYENKKNAILFLNNPLNKLLIYKKCEHLKINWILVEIKKNSFYEKLDHKIYITPYKNLNIKGKELKITDIINDIKLLNCEDLINFN